MNASSIECIANILAIVAMVNAFVVRLCESFTERPLSGKGRRELFAWVVLGLSLLLKLSPQGPGELPVVHAADRAVQAAGPDQQLPASGKQVPLLETPAIVADFGHGTPLF